VALRVFNAYGPHQPLPAAHAPVVPHFIKRAQSGGSVVVFGNGSQTRDYVYVTDAVNAMVSAAFANGIDRQVINVGSGIETAVADLIAEIGAAVGKPIDAIYNSGASGGVSRMRADLSRAAALLNYQPKVTLADGLRRTIANDPRFAGSGG
ncbi:MAG: NAD-dependent epimerase/dehydratase family protein, partial [Chloroflexi bacterium]|nr:NAD-dependent epimerase/dehydratase family protein [Chloroflexota bacterium]